MFWCSEQTNFFGLNQKQVPRGPSNVALGLTVIFFALMFHLFFAGIVALNLSDELKMLNFAPYNPLKTPGASFITAVGLAAVCLGIIQAVLDNGHQRPKAEEIDPH